MLNDEEVYSSSDKEKLAEVIQVDYISQLDDDEGRQIAKLASKTVLKATSTDIELKLLFSDPNAVSQDSTSLDQIEVTFDPTVFSDPDTELEVNAGEPLVIELPRQIDAEKAEQIESTMDVAQSTANAIATGNIAINIFLGASLKLLWGMINTLQFIVFFTEWNVQIPANASIAIETFRAVALGEFIPYDWLTEPIKRMTEGSNFSEEGDDDNEGRSVLGNMGIMLLFLLILLVLILVVIFVARIKNKPGSRVYGLAQWFKRKLLWNGVIRYVL